MWSGWNNVDEKPWVFLKTSHQYHPNFGMETSPPSSHLANSLDCKELLHFLGEFTASLAWHSHTTVITNLGNFVFNQDFRSWRSLSSLGWNISFQDLISFIVSLIVIYGCPYQMSHCIQFACLGATGCVSKWHKQTCGLVEFVLLSCELEQM